MSDHFATTHWSVVLAAGAGASPEADRALEELCATYWPPLYAYARRLGHDPDGAADLVQSLFASLLERGDLAKVDPAKGRFRAFLAACLRHHAANERARDGAARRGGGRSLLSLDRGDAERRHAIDPGHDVTPERLFERQWALALLAEVLGRLRAEYAARGQERVFDALKTHLAGEGDGTYAEAGTALGMSEGAVKVSVHRLRARYAEALRAAVARTLADPAEIDGELRALFDALGGG